MFKIGDKVRVINNGAQYFSYLDFFKENGIDEFLKFYKKESIHNGDVGIIEFIGTYIDYKGEIIVVLNLGDAIYLVAHDGLELVEEYNENDYNLKRETMAEKITTTNFEVELWKTDNAYTLYFDKYLMVELLKDEEIDELIYILQEAKKLKQ